MGEALNILQGIAITPLVMQLQVLFLNASAAASDTKLSSR